MYVKVQQDTLRLPLSKAVGVSVLNQAQILSHALISLDQGRLVVTGSDRQVEAVGSVAAEGRPERSRCLRARSWTFAVRWMTAPRSR